MTAALAACADRIALLRAGRHHGARTAAGCAAAGGLGMRSNDRRGRSAAGPAAGKDGGDGMSNDNAPGSAMGAIAAAAAAAVASVETAA